MGYRVADKDGQRSRQVTEPTRDNGGASSLSKSASPTYLLCCFFGLLFGFLGGWIINAFIFPLYDTVFFWTREISTALNAVALIALALVATWKSRFVDPRFVVSITVGCLTVGFITAAIGLLTQSLPVLVVGASLIAIGRGQLSVIVGVSCINLSLKQAGVVVACACFVAYVLHAVLLVVPPIVPIALFVAGPFLTLLLVTRYAAPRFRQVANDETPAQRAVTQPSSYLPFGHQLFVCLLLFRIAYGYSMTLGEVEGAPLATTLAILPLALAAGIAWFSKRELNPDTLFQASFLLVIAGFLLVAVPLDGKGTAVNTLLMSGVGCFEVLIWFVLITLGSRNPTAAPSVFAWGLSMNSIGVIIGANSGRLTNDYYGIDSPVVALIAAVLIFLFVAYTVVILRRFSFKETIAGVLPEHKPVAQRETVFLEQRCRDISEHYGLTARESEVFNLLARGRNGRFVQDELVVSYNTVKAHVKHIYAKLGIHTQQELIDLVEHEDTESPRMW